MHVIRQSQGLHVGGMHVIRQSQALHFGDDHKLNTTQYTKHILSILIFIGVYATNTAATDAQTWQVAFSPQDMLQELVM